MMNTITRIILISLIVLLKANFGALAQDNTQKLNDTVKNRFVEKMQAFAEKEARQSLDDFEKDKTTIGQSILLEKIKSNLQ